MQRTRDVAPRLMAGARQLAGRSTLCVSPCPAVRLRASPLILTPLPVAPRGACPGAERCADNIPPLFSSGHCLRAWLV